MSDSLERLSELLTERMERPLTPRETAELGTLLERHPDWRDDDFELAAGALVAGTTQERPLPEGLAEQIFDAIPNQRAPITTLQVPGNRLRAVGPKRSRRQLLVWTAGAVSGAALGTIVSEVLRRNGSSDHAAARLALLRDQATITQRFTAGSDPLVTSIQGDVVWSNEKQSGFMRFSAGLPVNDPRRKQYQLWIFDAERDDRYPIDGGVFDVTPGGEVVVPIKAKLLVHRPTLFAVTLEQPHGVVVSSREHLLVLAKIGT